MSKQISIPPKVRFSQNAEYVTEKCVSRAKNKNCGKPTIKKIEHVKLPVNVLKNLGINCVESKGNEQAFDSKEEKESNSIEKQKESMSLDILESDKKQNINNKPIDTLTETVSCMKLSEDFTPIITIAGNENEQNVDKHKDNSDEQKIVISKVNDPSNTKKVSKGIQQCNNKLMYKKCKNIKQMSQLNTKIRDTKPTPNLNMLQHSNTKHIYPFNKVLTDQVKRNSVSTVTKKKFARIKSPSNVKKTIIRDTTSKTSKAVIAPGILKCKDASVITKDVNSKTKTVSVMSTEKLNKPEYNSIMCTIDKLHEAQNVKPMKIDQLPFSIKNSIAAKVSTSLDFPPNQSIFKNLIDISIDERDLPSRLTRTKDPEPRQKDIVPKLSNFFIPKYSDEYCQAVFTSPREVQIIENYTPSKIINKILRWKMMLDDS